MKTTRNRELLDPGFVVVFACAACASRLPDHQSNDSPGAEKLLHFVANSCDGQYKIIPLQELKSRHYQAGLLPRLWKRGV